ncbi:MAG: guanylate kinase [Chlorobiota bacterium]|jgi:guanylate kinase|nr:guanylate kinase [Chlorobiota bacterium]
MPKQLIVISAPSGAGKTTVARHLLQRFPQLRFSVSATTRPKRPGEVDGRDYFFWSREQFEQAIARGELVEYEEIFGHLYGTLRSQVEQALSAGEFLLFDIDVKGALALRRAYPEQTFLIYVAPPSIEELERRLRQRGTESEEQIRRRLERAAMELQFQDHFDVVIRNEQLEQTLARAEQIVAQLLRGEVPTPVP